MDITFIRPNMSDARSYDAMEPLVFAVLAARTPPDVDTTLFDERLEPINYDRPTDLVALTVETYTARHAYQIATRFRQRGVPVVLGGYHPTFLPDEALRYADAVVIGDAEGLWEQVVEDARHQRLRRVYRQDAQPALDGLTLDRRIFRGKRYAPIGLVQYGRGCRYACDFCSIHAFYGTNVRHRPVREVVAEIEALNRKHILIVDDNIFIDVPAAEELFRALIPLKIHWSCQVSIDVAANAGLLKLMQQSGCLAALVGFESLDEANLTQMRKRWNLRHGDYATLVRRLQDHGIMVYGSFVFGYDHDTLSTFDRCVDFAVRHKFALANFNLLTPTPGAALYDRLRAEGRLLHDPWWLTPGYRYGDPTFAPRHMTAAQLAAGSYRARCEFNRYASIFRRAFDTRTNCRTPFRLGAYLVANLLARREIHHKQGRALGDGLALEPAPSASEGILP